MTESEDGFVISEKDLKLRGPGNFSASVSMVCGAEDCRPLSGFADSEGGAGSSGRAFAEGQESGADGASASESANRGIFGRKTSGNVSFSVFFLFLVVN